MVKSKDSNAVITGRLNIDNIETKQQSGPKAFYRHNIIE